MGVREWRVLQADETALGRPGRGEGMGKTRGQWGEVAHHFAPGPTNHPQNLAKASALGRARLLVAKSFPGALWVGPGGFCVLLPGKWPQGGNRGSVGVTHSGPESTVTQGALAIWLWPCLHHTVGQHSPCPDRRRGQSPGVRCARVCGHACTHICVQMAAVYILHVYVHVWTWTCVLCVCVCVPGHTGVHMF